MGGTALDDVGAQAQGRDTEALLGLYVGDGVVIEGLGSSRDVRIEISAAPAAYELLENDGHAFLLDLVAGGGEVVPRLLGEEAGVDEPNRVAELGEPEGGIGVGVGDHVGVVDPREGHHEHVLEEAGGADGQGTARHGEKTPEALDEGLGQGGREETSPHRFGRGLIVGEGPEVVLFEKALEFIDADEGREGDFDVDADDILGKNPGSRGGSG